MNPRAVAGPSFYSGLPTAENGCTLFISTRSKASSFDAMLLIIGVLKRVVVAAVAFTGCVSIFIATSREVC
jgi:hypothetical protein